MTNMQVQGTAVLTAADLEAIAAGSPPAGWWLFLYFVSESQSIVDGFRAGYNPG